jgi:hypothetical protein
MAALLRRRTVAALAFVAALLIALYFVNFWRPGPEAYLKSLPTNLGPFPRDAEMVERTKTALQKSVDEEAILRGVYYLWRVRSMDPSIETFLDEFCRSHESSAVRDWYRVLKSEDDPENEPFADR